MGVLDCSILVLFLCLIRLYPTNHAFTSMPPFRSTCQIYLHLETCSYELGRVEAEGRFAQYFHAWRAARRLQLLTKRPISICDCISKMTSPRDCAREGSRLLSELPPTSSETIFLKIFYNSKPAAQGISVDSWQSLLHQAPLRQATGFVSSCAACCVLSVYKNRLSFHMVPPHRLSQRIWSCSTYRQRSSGVLLRTLLLMQESCQDGSIELCVVSIE
jgi:hypothetical protein